MERLNELRGYGFLSLELVPALPALKKEQCRGHGHPAHADLVHAIRNFGPSVIHGEAEKIPGLQGDF